MALLTKMSQSTVVPEQVFFSNLLNSLRWSHCHSFMPEVYTVNHKNVTFYFRL